MDANYIKDEWIGSETLYLDDLPYDKPVLHHLEFEGVGD